VGVKLKANRSHIVIGGSVRLSGRVEPALPGEDVEIINAEDRVVTTAPMEPDGSFSTRLSPRFNSRFRARYAGAESTSVPVKVKPKVSVHLGKIRLFDKATVRGRVRPAVTGGRVEVRLFKNGKRVATKKTPVRRNGKYRTGLRIKAPGTYRARAVYGPAVLLTDRDASAKRKTVTPSLTIGSKSVYVRSLERRLRDLGYYLPGADLYYDYRTSDAMIAFNKVQGRARVGTVSSSTWFALARPKVPRPRYESPSYHIEIDQTRQVIFVVKKGEVRNILHTSTGAGGATRDGTFGFYRQVYGYSPNRLYYPSYFDGLRAIHGWPDVPTYPASHGCARVPMWAATWIQGKADIGVRVYVYH
jgi:peptidoglycan hydrolase-like protein with peptidoglycan-binding domain